MDDKPDYIKGVDGPEHDAEANVNWLYGYGNGRSVLVSELPGQGLHICLWTREYVKKEMAVMASKPNYCFSYTPGSQPTIEGNPLRFGIILSHYIGTEKAFANEGQHRGRIK
jgi:hypothetical protein